MGQRVVGSGGEWCTCVDTPKLPFERGEWRESTGFGGYSWTQISKRCPFPQAGSLGHLGGGSFRQFQGLFPKSVQSSTGCLHRHAAGNHRSWGIWTIQICLTLVRACFWKPMEPHTLELCEPWPVSTQWLSIGCVVPPFLRIYPLDPLAIWPFTDDSTQPRWVFQWHISSPTRLALGKPGKRGEMYPLVNQHGYVFNGHRSSWFIPIQLIVIFHRFFIYQRVVDLFMLSQNFGYFKAGDPHESSATWTRGDGKQSVRVESRKKSRGKAPQGFTKQ